MTRPTILVLATTVPATPGDGTPEFVLDLCRELAGAFEVTIVTPRVRGAKLETKVDGVRIHRFPYLPRRWETIAEGAILPNIRASPIRLVQVPFLMAAFLRHSLRAAKRIQPDATHAHWILPGGLIAYLLHRRRQLPYLVTVHGADAFALRGLVFRWLKRVVLRRAHFVGVVSADAASILPFTNPRQAVIPMGIPIEALQRDVGVRLPVPGRFLFVGRLASKKGVDVLLRSLSAVDNATLVVAGDGPDGPRLRSLAESLGLGRRVEFLGRVVRRDLAELYRKAFAVVVPSIEAPDGDKDGTPLVMAEAMAAGVPVIASRLGGLAEQIEHEVNGVLVRAGSVEDLAEAMRFAVDHPDVMTTMGERTRFQVAGGPLDIRSTGRRYTEAITLTLDHESSG